MAQRVQVGSGLNPERFQPRASPVNRFAAPPRERGKLAGLAEGLAAFNPSLARFADQTLDRQAKGQEMEGRSSAQRLIEEQQTYKKAVDEGLIRQDQNPWFRLGMKRQFALAAADRYAATLQAKASEMINAGIDDPSVFQGVESELRKQFMENEVGGGRDAGFDSFFADAANSKAAGIAQSFAAAAGAQAVQGFLDATGARASGIMRNLDGLDADEVGAALDAIGKEAVKEFGLSGTKVNDVLAEAIVAYARETGNELVLEYAKHIKTGGGSTLFDIPRFKDLVREARTAIDAEDIASRQRTEARFRLDGLEKYREFAEAIRDARKNGGSIHDLNWQQWADELRVYDNDLANAMLAIPANLDMADMVEDEVAFQNMAAQAVAGDLTMAQITQRWRSGTISDRSYQRLMELAYIRVNRERSLAVGDEDPFKDHLWNDKEAFLRRFAGSQTLFEQLQLEGGRATELMAERAKTYAMERWWEYWLTGGKDANALDRRRALDQIFEATQREFFPFREGSKEGQNLAQSVHNPLWGQAPTLPAFRVTELRGFVNGDNTMSQQARSELLRLGVDPRIVNLSYPGAIDEIDNIVRHQEAAHGMQSPPRPEALRQTTLDEVGGRPITPQQTEATGTQERGDREISRAGSGENPRAPTQRPARPTRPERPTRPDTAERLREGRRKQEIESVEKDLQAANRELESLRDQSGSVAAQNRRVWERRAKTLQDRLDRLNAE
jgi:hypothetical protein